MPRTIPQSSLSWRDAFYVSSTHDLYVARVNRSQVDITCNGHPYDVVKCHLFDPMDKRLRKQIPECYRKQLVYKVMASEYDPIMIFCSELKTYLYDIPTKDFYILPLTSTNNLYSVEAYFSPWHRWIVFAQYAAVYVYDRWSQRVNTLPKIYPYMTQCAFSGPDELVLVYQGNYSIWDLPSGMMKYQGQFPFDRFSMCYDPLWDARHLLVYDHYTIQAQPLTRKRSHPSRLVFTHTNVIDCVTWSPDRKMLMIVSVLEKPHQDQDLYMLQLWAEGHVHATYSFYDEWKILPQAVLVYNRDHWTLHPWICVQPYQDALNEHLPTVLSQLVLLYRFPVYFGQHPHYLFPDL